MLQDIQSLREARERLGNAKPPGSPSAEMQTEWRSRKAICSDLPAGGGCYTEAGTHLLPPGTRGREPGEEDPEQVLRRLSVLAGLFIFGLWSFRLAPGGATKSRRALLLPGNRAGQTAATLSQHGASASAAGSLPQASTDGGNPEHGRFGCIIAHAETASCDQILPVAAAPSSLWKAPEAVPAGRIYPTLAEAPVRTHPPFLRQIRRPLLPRLTARFSPTLEIEVTINSRGQSLDLGGYRLTYNTDGGTDKKRLVVFHHVRT